MDGIGSLGEGRIIACIREKLIVSDTFILLRSGIFIRAVTAIHLGWVIIFRWVATFIE